MPRCHCTGAICFWSAFPGPENQRSDGNWRVEPGKTLRGTGPEMSSVTQRKQVRRALAEGKNVRARITVRAHDAAGNVATAHRTIRFVKGARSKSQ